MTTNDLRASLIERFGNAPATVSKIDAYIETEREIRGTKRGSKESKNARQRARLKWIQRRDELMAELEARPATTGGSALEARYPTVKVATLVNAAKVHLSAHERMTAEEAQANERIMVRLYGHDWIEDFIEMLEQHDAGWLARYFERLEAREAAEFAAEWEAGETV